MARPTSAIHICNLALDRLGQREIASIDTPTNANEEICARHYDQTRREALRRYIFNFAKKYAVLTVSATKTPAHGYTYAYALPNDFIRLLVLGDIVVGADIPPGLFDLSEGYLFTDYGDGGSVNITYVYDAVTVSAFDPLFIRLLELMLAAAMAYKFTLKNSLVQAIRDDLADVALSAAAVAGQEKPPRRIQRSNIRDARRFGYRNRDNTHVF